MSEPGADQSFAAIYERLARVVQEDAARQGLEQLPTTLHPALAGASRSAIPRRTLLDLEDDTDFVVACYILLIDRPPFEKELAWRLRRMRRGNATREVILDEIATGWTVTKRGYKVGFT